MPSLRTLAVEAEARVRSILASNDAIAAANEAIAADAEWLLDAILGHVPPPEPQPDDRNWALDPVWGGAIGSGGRKVVTGRCWDGQKIGGLDEDTDYVDCVHRNYCNPADGDEVTMGWGDTIPKRVRFFNLLVKNVECEYWAYINHGHDEEKNKLWLAIDGLTFEDCNLKAGLEIKGSVYLLRNLRIGSGCQMNQLLRKRHGRQAVIIGGDAKGAECSFRGWCDWCDVPGAVAVGNAGNLDSRYESWEEDHEAGGGNNMQREEGLFCGPRVKAIKLGYKSNDSCSKYKCLDSLIHPDAPEPQIVGPEEGWERDTPVDYLALWQAYGLEG